MEQSSTALTGAAGGRKAADGAHGAGARWAPFSADRAGRRDMVLHEPLKELVGGFGGEEGHGKQLLSGE